MFSITSAVTSRTGGRLARGPSRKTTPSLPAGVLRRNDTSFPALAAAKLRKLFEQYTAAQNTGDEWANVLKYYQYLVRAVMSDPEYGIGADGNARGILVYHTMGMGKTRLAVAVAMALWDLRPVVVMLARSLHKNFRETVASVITMLNPAATPDALAALLAEGDSHLTFISMDAYNAADQIARAGTKRKAKRGDIAGATGGIDGKLLIVDEAHNFFRAIINSSAETSNARRIYDMIMIARDLRILFLTGTPAAKDPFEFVPCFNMLTGTDLLPTQYEIFYKLYVDRAEHRVRNRDRLANRLVGLVSHVTHTRPSAPERAAGTAKRARDEGWFPDEMPTIVERVEMGSEQYRYYLLAREKEDAEGKGGEGAGGRGAGLMTAPPLAIPGSEKKTMSSYFVKSRSLSTFASPQPGTAVDNLPDDAFTADVSPKLHLIASRADAAPGPVLVYSQFIESALKPLGRYMRLLGYVPYVRDGSAETPSSAETHSRTYAIISGETSPDDRDAIKQAFNTPANAHGAVIKAIFVSKTGAEGLDLKWLRETHQIEPYWDRARDDQVKARAVRIGSHDGLPEDEREVQPYLYIAMPNRQIYENMLERDRELKTIDEVFFERALDRYLTNAAFRQLLAEISLECEIFGYGACRVCVPNGAPLFHDDPALDIRLPDPCDVRCESDVSALPLVVGDTTYYYTVDPASPLGYTFYEYRKDLGGYTPIDPSNPVIATLLRALRT